MICLGWLSDNLRLHRFYRSSIHRNMAQMNISVPENLKGWAEQRVRDGRYATINDYVTDLMRRDQDAVAELAWLQSEIDKGRASGVDPRAPSQVINDVVAEYHARNG
jgi:antitoxin ParD1/3/4